MIYCKVEPPALLLNYFRYDGLVVTLLRLVTRRVGQRGWVRRRGRRERERKRGWVGGEGEER